MGCGWRMTTMVDVADLPKAFNLRLVTVTQIRKTPRKTDLRFR